MNSWELMRQALEQARQVNSAADQYANQMAPMLRGRLRKCSASDLKALKKELRDFNMRTGNWKD